MKIQKCITFTSALLLLAVVPSLAQEQLFEIRNRSYGNANAFPGVQDEIDALFDIMETSINDLLPTLDTTKYMKGMANAGRTSLAGIGTDYTSPFKWFLIGFNAGASIDLGDIAVSQILNRTASVADFGGFGPAAGFTIATNAGNFLKSPILFIQPDRLTGYLTFMTAGRDVDIGELVQGAGTANLKFSQFLLSATAQYRILPGQSWGARSLSWRGVDVSGGLQYSSIGVHLTSPLTQTITGALANAANANMSLNFDGTVDLGAKIKTFNIPMEASTAFRLAYILNMYTGLGLDLALGSASVTEEPLTGPITVTEDSGNLGDITADAALNLGQSSGPTLVNLRYFLGTSFEMGVLAFHVQLTKGLMASTFGLTAGVKAFW